MKTRKEQSVSPFAEVAFPHLDKPDTHFDAKGKYSVNLVMDPTIPEHSVFLSKIAEVGKKAIGPNATYPVKQQTDRDGNASGCKLVRFSSTYRPKLFDSRNQPLPEGTVIGQGSVISVAYTLKPYKGIGGRSGVSIYLNAVKVKTLKEPRGATAASYGFPDDTSGEAAVDNEEELPPDEQEVLTPGKAELPF